MLLITQVNIRVASHNDWRNVLKSFLSALNVTDTGSERFVKTMSLIHGYKATCSLQTQTINTKLDQQWLLTGVAKRW